MGWRGVANGLGFLHDKAGISHNNLDVACVYVNVVDSQWKVGGFEAAYRHRDMTPSVREHHYIIFGLLRTSMCLTGYKGNNFFHGFKKKV